MADSEGSTAVQSNGVCEDGKAVNEGEGHCSAPSQTDEVASSKVQENGETAAPSTETTQKANVQKTSKEYDDDDDDDFEMDDTGIFDDWYASICFFLKDSGKLDKVSKLFGRIKKDEDRVNFAQRLKIAHSTMRIDPMYKCKSVEEAVRLREDGNKLFQSKQNTRALEKYTESVITAPIVSDNANLRNREYSLALGNRSAVLYHMKKYSECLQDIDSALQHGYPEELRYKLYDRRAKCFMLQKRKTQAIEELENALSSLNITTLGDKKKAAWKKDLDSLIDKCNKMAVDESWTVEKTEQKEVPKLSRTQNDAFPAASIAFDIESTESQGRFAVAAEDIKIGDVVIVEKPYASVLLPEHFMTHCHHCFKRVLAPTPCVKCSTVCYCSVSCRQLSWSTYHKYECRYMTLLVDSGLGKFGLLAIRAITVKDWSYFKTMRERFAVEPPKPPASILGSNPHGVYDPDDYKTIKHLVTHCSRRSVNDLFRRTLEAVFLTKVLKAAGYFAESAAASEDGEVPYCDQGFIGGLMLSHLQSFPCNAHEVSELGLLRHNVPSSPLEEIGAAIYGTISLLNHSCDPAVNRNFYGDTVVIRAIKPIAKGEEISDNYGFVYPVQPKWQRQTKLYKQYFFACNCEACKDNWPMYASIDHEIPMFKCLHCHVPLQVPFGGDVNQGLLCRKCNRTQALAQRATELDLWQQKFLDVFSLVSAAKCDQAYPMLIDYLTILHNSICLPWRDFNDAQEALKQCLSIMANCYEK